MKIGFIAVVGTASLVASADAGFLGFVASQRVVGANTIVDIYAGVSNASDKFLSVYNLNASTSITGGFVQGGTLALKAWKPDSAGFTSTRDSIDSFMTSGTFSGGAYGGVYYASANTNGDPNFTGVTGAWSGTPGSAPATTIPANAGWFTGDPTSVDNNAESLAGLVGRVNGTGASAANYGIWCAHLVFASTSVSLGTNVLWNGVGSAKDGVTGATTSATSSFAAVPAPGAVALLGLAGLAGRRRRL